MQMRQIWVGTGLLPASKKSSTPADINWSSGFGGSHSVSPADAFIYDPNFFGISRCKDVIFVRLTLAEGRVLEQKRFYKRVVDDRRDRLGVGEERMFSSASLELGARTGPLET